MPALLAATLIGALVVVTACTPGRSETGPGPSQPAASQDGGSSPEAAAAALAAGLGARDISEVEFVGQPGTAADEDYAALIKGIPTVKPVVSVAGVDRKGAEATASLSYTWTFPGVATPWTYQTTAQLAQENGRWKSRWQPSVVQPDLDDAHRLSARRVAAERGEILGEDGAGLMIERSVVRIGIDKSQVSGDAAATSARRLADLVDIDADAYLKKVAGAGTEAFVEAITLRAQDPDRPDNQTVSAIKGALAIEGEQVLAPTREFARPILGTVGEATKEIVDASKGAVITGDEVGLSGLEKRYDAKLRGQAGVQIRLLPLTTASPTPSDTPSPSESAGATEARVLTEIKAVPGQDVTTSLNEDLQSSAEKILDRQRSAAALVAVRPSTGAIVVAAVNEAADGQALATVGQAAPGSTFKVVSALALLRAGLSPDSQVSCPRSVTVDGARYENYDDYPSGSLGTIDLRTALAQSCNTAFVGERDQLKGDDLTTAAGSLGLGIDYDTGYPSYFGSVPKPDSQTAAAEAMFGQGKDLASPMAMAAVMASVAAGNTVVPHLVAGFEPKPSGTALSADEAKTLRSMMRGVVTEGSGRFLADLPGGNVIAKTGTAEYGSKNPKQTHAWMIAAQDDLAVCVFVNAGSSGSGTAGPLLEAFLRSAQ